MGQFCGYIPRQSVSEARQLKTKQTIQTLMLMAIISCLFFKIGLASDNLSNLRYQSGLHSAMSYRKTIKQRHQQVTICILYFSHILKSSEVDSPGIVQGCHQRTKLLLSLCTAILSMWMSFHPQGCKMAAEPPGINPCPGRVAFVW